MTQTTHVLNQESFFIEQHGYKLHLRHIWQGEVSGPPVLMIHGAIENGLIFYTKKGKGLGCYLAQQGFDVYVADLRGRGESTPAIHQDPNHSQYDSITKDIPALINTVKQKTGKSLHLVCHSWGGVLAASTLLREPTLRQSVNAILCFGTKRQVTVWNLERLLKIEIFWHRAAQWLARKHGYLDAIKLKAGSDNETLHTLTQGANWVKRSKWIDSEDGFDYENAAQSFDWPPTWHITGVKDNVLGHAQDVQLFIQECHNTKAKFTRLARASGNALDYDHINILTHKEALTDHFPMLVTWLKEYS